MIKTGHDDLVSENYFRNPDKSEKKRKANKKSVPEHYDKEISDLR